MNTYSIVREFETELGKYTGAPYVVCVDSCTNAIFLSCYRLNVKSVTIPKKTYLSVPMSIIHSGGKVKFEDLDWSGIYQLKPYPIWDSCKIGKGGAILCDNKKDYEWFKRARFMGRGEISYHDDEIDFCG